MTRTEHLLIILAEECAEVAHRASKALRFGLSEVEPGQALTNAWRIRKELHDLEAIVGMLEDEGSLPREYSLIAQINKVEKVKQFLEYSAKCGTLARTSTTGQREGS